MYYQSLDQIIQPWDLGYLYPTKPRVSISDLGPVLLLVSSYMIVTECIVKTIPQGLFIL